MGVYFLEEDFLKNFIEKDPWVGTGRVLIMIGGLGGPGSEPNSNQVWSIGTLIVYS
jgi:hypothetical protein